MIKGWALSLTLFLVDCGGAVEFPVRRPPAAVGRGPVTRVSLIGRESVWRFDDGTEARAPIGSRKGYVKTHLPEPGKLRCRREFGVPGRMRSLTLRILYEESFVLSLNGRECLRGSARGPGMDRIYEEHDLTDFADELRSGERNVLAVEVTGGPDGLSFDAELLGEMEPASFDAPSPGEIPRRYRIEEEAPSESSSEESFLAILLLSMEYPPPDESAGLRHAEADVATAAQAGSGLAEWVEFEVWTRLLAGPDRGADDE